MRIGLIVEYDGTEFHGSQTQIGVRTVQGELEKALETVFLQEIRVQFASRTDAGVHAKGQVAAADVETEHTEETIRKALNHYLPEDARIKTVARVDDRFDPRRSARAREYVYTLTDAAVPSPLRRRFEAPVKGRLAEGAMGWAGRVFEGVHDFASFAGPATPEGASTTRRIDRVSTRRSDDQVTVTFRGNAFLHRQVRRMTAALVEVGQARTTGADLTEYLEKPQRGAARRIMPARGLCLEGITYDDAGPEGLPLMNGIQE